MLQHPLLILLFIDFASDKIINFIIKILRYPYETDINFLRHMKQVIFIILLVLYIIPVSGNNNDIKAPVMNVTVYPDRAQLFHETVVQIPSGNSVLRFTGLSPYIDDQSIQVKGFGDFTIVSVNHQNNYLENLEELPEIKSIRDQIENLLLKVEEENAAISVLKEKESFLVANRAILVKETTFTIEQLRSVMDLYTNNMNEITMTVLKKNRLIKDYEKQIAALRKQIAERTERSRLPSGEITVTVSADRTVSGRMSFSYVVGNTGWYPSYDIRVENTDKPVNIIYKANLHQNTGLSWKDVKLSFSNARPWIAGNVPELNSWFIDYYNPPSPGLVLRGTSTEARKSSAIASAEMDARDNTAMRQLEAVPLTVGRETGETSVTFDVAIPYSIASDGKIQTVEIYRSSVPAEYKYVTIPKLSPHAYLTAGITEWDMQGMQSGEAILYFENSFVGKSRLDMNQPGDTLMVSLGTDNGIIVKREKQKDYTSRRILGSNKTEIFSFLITLRNNKPAPVKVSLYDQIPISSNSEISVEATELSGGDLNKQTGEIEWDLEIQPKETKNITLTYSVRYPKDKTIILE